MFEGASSVNLMISYTYNIAEHFPFKINIGNGLGGTDMITPVRRHWNESYIHFLDMNHLHLRGRSPIGRRGIGCKVRLVEVNRQTHLSRILVIFSYTMPFRGYDMNFSKQFN